MLGDALGLVQGAGIDDDSQGIVQVVLHIGIVYKELLEAYAALMQNPTGNPSGKEVVQFGEYVRWFVAQDRQEGLNYWREYLAGYEVRSPLPGRRQNSGLDILKPVYDLRKLRLDLSEELSQGIRHAAEVRQTTRTDKFGIGYAKTKADRWDIPKP